MKKTVTILLTLALLLALAGCESAVPSAPGGAEPKETALPLEELPPVEPAEELPDAAALLDETFVDPLTGWEEYDRLIETAETAADLSRRTEALRRAERMLLATGAVVPLTQGGTAFRIRDGVSGVYADPLGAMQYMHAVLPAGMDTFRGQLAAASSCPDPALAHTPGELALAANFFTGLYVFDEDGRTVPACAESYEISEDGCTYTVHLKKDAVWSDGSLLLAQDFAYAWNRAANLCPAEYAYLFQDFEGYGTGEISAWAMNNQTLVFTLTAPCADMETRMAMACFAPVKEASTKRYAGWPSDPGNWCREAGFICNGPYIATSRIQNGVITTRKNLWWYDADSVTADFQELLLTTDPLEAGNAFRSGALDAAETVSDSAGGEELGRSGKLSAAAAVFRLDSPLFAGKTPEQAACLRQALSLLIDRSYLCENVSAPGSAPAGGIVPDCVSDGQGGLFRDGAAVDDPAAIRDAYEDTMERVRLLLRAAGYRFDDDGRLSPETPLSFLCLTDMDPVRVAVSEAVQADFFLLGIRMSIDQQEAGGYRAGLEAGNYDLLCHVELASKVNDPLALLRLFTTRGELNLPGFGD